MKKVLGILIMAVALFAIATVSVSAETTSQDYIVGDTDLDGTISIKDATMAQVFVAHLESLTAEEQKAADCDENEGLQIMDATIIQMYVSQIGMDFPVNADGYKIGDTVSATPATLKSGSEFKETIKTVNTDNTVKRIVFDYWNQHSSRFTWEDGLPVDENDAGKIRLFTNDDKSTIYILSKSDIYTAQKSNSMFRGLSGVNYIIFNNIIR